MAKFITINEKGFLNLTKKTELAQFDKKELVSIKLITKNWDEIKDSIIIDIVEECDFIVVTYLNDTKKYYSKRNIKWITINDYAM